MSLKRYNGSSWVDINDVRRYNGSSWIDCNYARRYDGSSWKDVWPNAKVGFKPGMTTFNGEITTWSQSLGNFGGDASKPVSAGLKWSIQDDELLVYETPEGCLMDGLSLRFTDQIDITKYNKFKVILRVSKASSLSMYVRTGGPGLTNTGGPTNGRTWKPISPSSYAMYSEQQYWGSNTNNYKSSRNTIYLSASNILPIGYEYNNGTTVWKAKNPPRWWNCAYPGDTSEDYGHPSTWEDWVWKRAGRCNDYKTYSDYSQFMVWLSAEFDLSVIKQAVSAGVLDKNMYIGIDISVQNYVGMLPSKNYYLKEFALY